jgi:PAS domain S-box-containing protein
VISFTSCNDDKISLVRKKIGMKRNIPAQREYVSSDTSLPVKEKTVEEITLKEEFAERNYLKERLAQSEAKFKVIAESNMIGLVLWNEKQEIVDFNDAFLNILGYQRQEVLKERFSLKELTPPEFWEADERAYRQMAKSGSCKPYEKELLGKDGQTVPVLVGGAFIEAEDYRGISYVVDISERKEREKEKDIFLGHELKNPLATIKGFSQLLIKKLEKRGDVETVSYLKKIDKKVNHLTKIINDITDLSRLRAGKMEFSDELFSFDRLVKELVRDFQASLIDEHRHEIVLEGQTQKKIFADKTRITQAINNLLSNAVKYSPEADKVVVRLSSDESSLQIEVQDFGVGISKEDKTKVFQPFYRSVSGKKSSSGVGLGLYITERILRYYRGKIEVESTLGKGSIFRVTLPLKIKERKKDELYSLII